MSQSPTDTFVQAQPCVRINCGVALRRVRVFGSAVQHDLALWACLAVIGLSLLSAYVMVLRDAVRNGETWRANFAQQVPASNSPSQNRQAGRVEHGAEHL